MCTRDVSLKFSEWLRRMVRLWTPLGIAVFSSISTVKKCHSSSDKNDDRCFSCRQRVNGQCQRLAHSILDFGEQEKGEEKLLEHPRTIRLSMPIIDCSSLPLRDAVHPWDSATQTSDWCGESSWPIAVKRGTIEMDRWSVLSTALKNKNCILLDPLNDIETRNRCWKVWMNEWMLLPIVEVTSPLYSSVQKRKPDGWRSVRTEQTAEIVLRCATSRLEDRRLRSTGEYRQS